jgi:hypothetical protein
LRRKNKSEKEASVDVAPPLIEPEFPQVSEVPLNTEGITCPNSKCGKVFNKPLELIDLARPSEGSSLVCPYCLTKLEQIQPKQETAIEAISCEKPQDVAEQKEGKCPHFVGYLGKRPKNTPIPDFCLTCPEMMKCMLG